MNAGLPAVLADYNWGQYKRFVDIGGAHGSVLAGLMAQHPKVDGVLFDQPEVSYMRDLHNIALSC
jgi:hypothetical protein